MGKSSVETWLSKNGLDALTERFKEQRVETIVDVLEFREDDLVRVCTENVGDLVRLRRHVQLLKEELLTVDARLRLFDDQNAAIETVWSTSMPLTFALWNFKQYQVFLVLLGFAGVMISATTESWVRYRLFECDDCEKSLADVDGIIIFHDVVCIFSCLMWAVAGLLGYYHIGSRFAPKWWLISGGICWGLALFITGLGMKMNFLQECSYGTIMIILAVVVALDERNTPKGFLFVGVAVFINMVLEGILIAVNIITPPHGLGKTKEEGPFPYMRIGLGIFVLLLILSIIGYLKYRAYETRKKALLANQMALEQYQQVWADLQKDIKDVEEVSGHCELIRKGTKLDTSQSYGAGAAVTVSKEKLRQGAPTLQALFLEAWLVIDPFDDVVKKLAATCAGESHVASVKTQTRVM